MRRLSRLKVGENIVTRRCAYAVWLWCLGFAAVTLMVCSTQAQTADAPREDIAPPIGPPDVYIRTLLVQDELELIRLEMGKPKDTRRELQVTEAEPREVFFQALTLFHKANRLSFDLTRERAELPEKPVGTPRPADVRAVVDAVLAQLQRVKAALGSFEQSLEKPRDAAVTPSDVFRSIVQANRQVNLLLDRHTAPSDVFQQVTLAVSYAAQLRTRFPGTRMPETPTYERRKRPADVYHRLIECFSRVRTIMAHSGFSALTLGQHPEAVNPSDVYDIASLIVAELSFLHAQLGDVLAPRIPTIPDASFQPMYTSGPGCSKLS